MSSPDTNIFHRVPVLDRHRACVALRPKKDFIHLLFKQCGAFGKVHTCDLPVNNTTEQLPSAFEKHLPIERISIMINRVLSSDAQAMEQFLKGVVVSKQIPIYHRPVLDLISDNPSLEDYREMRLLSGDLVRPLLLTRPNLDYLMPFQVRGVEWLTQNSRGILADDMGLGKTVQAVTALRLFFNSGLAETALIICPKSLLANWKEELSRWAPELSCLRITPSVSIRDEVWQVILGKVHVLLTNYEQMRRPSSTLVKYGIDVVIADEAHRMRNIGALVARGIRRLKSHRFWALTGTPIERDSSDLATLLSTIEPARFSISDKTLHPMSLRAQARPYFLRRLKSEVLPELPEVLESKETLELLRSQRSSYRRACRRLGRLDEPGILALINELRTICDYDESTGESTKADRIIEIVQDVQAAAEKAIVFSYLLRPLDILQERLAQTIGSEAVVGLRGAMTTEARGTALRTFKSDPRATVLLCSSRVGGEGLTLTEANHVIFFNEWWNPSANMQARDRVVRIGQRRGVRVYKFKCRSTIEEDLETILDDKSQTMFDLVDRLAESSAIVEDLRPVITKLQSKLLANNK